MTEQEWLSCMDPTRMLDFLQKRASDRKIRLLSCSCSRHFWSQLDDAWTRRVMEAAEEYADDVNLTRELASLDCVARQAAQSSNHPGLAYPVADLILQNPWHAALDLIQYCEDINSKLPQTLMAEVIGNPFRPVRVDPRWVTWNEGCVVNLAQASYEERELPSGHLDNTRLGILADALEDAGCQDGVILGHLRGPGIHVRGCWVLDLLLGKE